MALAKKKTTIYIDENLLRSVKILAASTDRHDYEVIEEALSQYVDAAQQEARRQALLELLGELRDSNDLNDADALDLAYAELHAMRSEHRRA